MSTGRAASLAEQRLALRLQLRVQRLVLEQELAAAGAGAGASGGYPRSATLRWLIREPELVGKLVGRIAGGRAAAALPGVLLLLRFLRSTVVRR